jgi:hypothetical protein
MSALPVIKGGTRILDFDIENRPLSYWVPDRPSAEVTAISACWVGRPSTLKVWLLGPSFTNAEHRAQMTEMLMGFKEMYDQADMVTGHYIRRHDLPIVNAGLVEWGLPLLKAKLTQDTKLDLVRFSDIPKTQENLADMLNLAEKKLHMKQSMWREANRLTVEGLDATRRRVAGDVRQHMRMRKALLEHGLLHRPRVWVP